MNEPAPRGSRVVTAFALLVAVIAFGVLCWRAALPNNRHRDIDFHRTESTGPIDFQRLKTANGYDDVVTVVTARNFARDGFLQTHLLPNRAGAPQVSFFDFTETQCEPLGAPRDVLRYVNVFGQPIDMVALNNDCIYTHYPPLADWVFGAMAAAGLGGILHYKVLALLLSCSSLVLLYLWLRREVSEAAALSAMIATATLPAFFQWAGALYYQPFQYLFLVAGMLSWSVFLERRRARWALATWVLFFCESLVSYELVLCFGTVLLGLLLLDRRDRNWLSHVKLLSLQVSAPVAALLLHLALRLSLFGLERTWSNGAKTLQARTGMGVPLILQSLQELALQTGVHVLRLDLLALSLAAVLAVRLAVGVSAKRPAALLGILLVGGATFSIAFPATSVFHFWMMYRHLLPFVALLLALLAEGLFLSLSTLAAGGRAARIAVRVLALAGVVVSGTPFGWLLSRNAKEIAAEATWNAQANRYHDPRNLAARFLDVLYWKSVGSPGWEERVYLAVDGRRVNVPPNPNTEFRTHPATVSHYEIWWLNDVSMTAVNVLTGRTQARVLAEDCGVSVLERASFRPVTELGPPALDQFVPAPGEVAPGADGYTWVRFSFATPARSRALRLTCREDVIAIPLHEIEVLRAAREHRVHEREKRPFEPEE